MHPGLGGDLLEGAVPLVVEEKIRGLVVGDIDVGVAIAVEIRGGRSHSPAL